MNKRKLKRNANLKNLKRWMFYKEGFAKRPKKGRFLENFGLKSMSLVETSILSELPNANDKLIHSSMESQSEKSVTSLETKYYLETSDSEFYKKKIKKSNFLRVEIQSDLSDTSAVGSKSRQTVRFGFVSSRLTRSKLRLLKRKRQTKSALLSENNSEKTRFLKNESNAHENTTVSATKTENLYRLPEPPAEDTSPFGSPLRSLASFQTYVLPFEERSSDETNGSTRSVSVQQTPASPKQKAGVAMDRTENHIKFIPSPFKLSKCSRKNSLDFFFDSPIKGLILSPGSQTLQHFKSVKRVKGGSCSIDLGTRINKTEGSASAGRKLASHRRSHGRSSSVDSSWESPQCWFQHSVNAPVENKTANNSCNHHPNYNKLKNFISCFAFSLGWYPSNPPLQIKDKNPRPNSMKKSIKCFFSYPNKWHLSRKSKINRIECVDSQEEVETSNLSSRSLTQRHLFKQVSDKENASFSIQKKHYKESHYHPQPLPSLPNHQKESNKCKMDRMTTESAYSAKVFEKDDSIDAANSSSLNSKERVCSTNDALAKVLSENAQGNYIYNDSLDFDDSLSDMLVAMHIESSRWLNDLQNGNRKR